MKKYFTTLLMALFMALFMAMPLVLNSCGDDEEDYGPGTSTAKTFTVNNVANGRIFSALCSDNDYSDACTLEIVFIYTDPHDEENGEGMQTFILRVNDYKLADMHPGLNISQNIEVRKFFPSSTIFIGDIRYDELGGSAKVKSVNDTGIVVEFSNFKFSRTIGEYGKPMTFAINGTIAYEFD